MLNQINKLNLIEQKTKEIVLNYNHLDLFSDNDKYYNDMVKSIRLDCSYCLLLRVCYDTNESQEYKYRLLGTQISVNLSTHDELDIFIKDLVDVIDKRLRKSNDKYHYKFCDVIDIQIILYRLGSIKNIAPKVSRKSLSEYKGLINISKTYESFKILPTIPNEEDFGVLLNKQMLIDNNFELILKDGNIFNPSTILKYNTNTKISLDYDYYQKTYKDSEYIFMVKKEKNILDITTFNIKGFYIDNFTLEKIGSNNYIRQSGNLKFYIDNRGVYKKDLCIKFNPVYSNKLSGFKASLWGPDWKIGTLDIETYYSAGVNKTYAIGFYVKDNIQKFYIDKTNLDSDKLIVKCLENMICEKYNGYTFFVHNLTGYESIFLLKILISHTKFTYKFITRDEEDIIGYKISVKIPYKNRDKVYSIRLVDSYNFLKGSLRKLCETFNTPIKKSYFPYTFVNKNTLFYKGIIPEIKYYEGISVVDYAKLKHHKKIWDLKEQCLHYLENDLISLYSVMDKFIYKVYLEYNVHVTNSLTISSLAMQIFLRRFYKKNIPLIKNKSIYNDIKNSYFGGITEVYKPHGKNLYYYDVNSLYPYSALNAMPGLNCVFNNNINDDLNNIKDNLFGFYYCKIHASHNYLGLLPYRTDSGIAMPLGYIEGWYFSEELKFALENGYNIEVVKGYSFNKEYNVFNKYVNHLYKIKSTTKDSVEYAIVKSLLNNLLGRFGLDVNKYITDVVSEDDLIELIQTRKLRNNLKFIEDKVFVSYEKNINRDICEKFGLDYNSLIKNSKNVISNDGSFRDVSVAISSAVTSYGRIFMNKVKLDILEKGGSIYYTDTDSIVTDIKLDDSMVGNELGKFKLVDKIIEGYFISNKRYGYKYLDTKTNEVKSILKVNTISRDSIKYEDLNSLYLNKEVEGFNYYTKKDLGLGSVTIKNEQVIKLSPFSYTKRTKVFNNNNQWVDTKPIILKKYHTSKYDNISSTIKNILLDTTLFLLFILLLAIYLIVSDDSNIFYDESNIFYNDNSNIIDTNTTNVIENSDSNIKSKENTGRKKSFFDKFINLFRSDNNYKKIVANDTINSGNNTVFKESFSNIKVDNNLNVNDLPIFKEILKHHKDLNNTEINQLQLRVSNLEHELKFYKMNNKDVSNMINDIIRDYHILQNNKIL